MKASLAVMMLLLTGTVAQAADLYRVEVMMFAYLDEQSAQKEHWQETLETEEEQIIPDAEVEDLPEDDGYAGESLPVDDMTEETPEPELPYQPLEDLEFADAATRFAYRNDIAIIWHQAWVEEIQDADNAILHDVDTVLEGELKVQVSGSVRLHRSRYIHITPDLSVQQYVLGFPLDETDIQEETSETEITEPAAPQDHPFAAFRMEPELIQETEVTKLELAPEEPVWMPLRAAHIDRSRRMRSDEVHYLDHPLLGMVVKVTPYEAPPEEETSEDSAAPEADLN
ncbi:CsiV family protein [Thalassolituus sp.]|uniref:CsiV family protein n=1 Tax=Thalassolituus sp. TaxID=2030822 RepID=UPI0035119FDE